MQPHEKIHHLFYILLRKLFISVGHDFFDDGKIKPNLLTYLVYGHLGMFYIGAIYTLIYYDWAEKLNIIAFTGITFQV